MPLTQPVDRFAAKLVANYIHELLEDPMGGLAPVVHICELTSHEREQLYRRLRVMKERLEAQAELPERVVDWREAVEAT